MNNLTDNTRPTFVRIIRKIEYRVHFDQKTKICTQKTVEEDITTSTNYIVVNKEVYDSIAVCSVYRVNNNTLEKQPKKLLWKKIEKHSSGTLWSIKDNMIFVATKEYTGPIDQWRYIT